MLRKSPLDIIPGPPSPSFLFGNMLAFFDPGWAFYRELMSKYPAVVRMAGFLNDRLLFVHDPLALHHIIVKEQYIYEETPLFLLLNKLMFGEGLLATVGDHHKHQRKMLNPVFHTNHMRNMTPIFYDVTHKLKNSITRQVIDGPCSIDVLNWMTRAALEMVGQGGLGHSFDTLEKDEINPVAEAIKSIVPTIGPLLVFYPLLPFFSNLGTPAFRRKLLMMIPWPRVQRCREIADLLSETSQGILKAKREALAKGGDGEIEGVAEGKDIMSVLLRANMSASEEDRLPDNEILGHMSTLTFAAMETTSGALAHILHLLAEHPTVQDRLRQELLSARSNTTNDRGDIEYDELMTLPYLDAVCRETLRLHPPVPSVTRKTTQPTILPLSQPIPSSDPSSPYLSQIAIPKGTEINISILASNVNPATWGPDAHLWRPERWLEPLREEVLDAKVPGIYSNLMSFLGGGRACIGFKFSQLEMKIVLSILISTFKFSLPEKTEIAWNFGAVQYPSVVGDGTGRASMPLVVGLVEA